MKKLILTGAFLFALGVNAQDIYTTNGTLISNRTLTLGSYSLHFKPSSSNGLFINNAGKVGIGTVSPTKELDVNGGIQASTGVFTNTQVGPFSSADEKNSKCLVFSAGKLLDSKIGARTFNYYDFPNSEYTVGNTVLLDIEDRSYKTRMSFLATEGSSSKLALYDKDQQQFFKVQEDVSGAYLIMNKPNTTVCIGTTTNTDGDGIYYKLSVSGIVRAYEVKVYNTWADYVFEDDYVLKPLEEVEQFINENGHLPNVPSAETIEEKGLELGNMMKIQQEKIEELTLYLIEQKKENNELKKDVEELKALVKALTEKE